MSNLTPQPQRVDRPFNRRRTGLWSKLRQVLLHPVVFFRSLTDADTARHWLWAALLILAVTGFAAVRLTAPADEFAIPVPVGDQLETALIAASGIVLAWIGQAVVLMIVPLLSGKIPSFGLNFRVAIWASVPLGLLAVVQILYLSIGGQITSAGLTGLVVDLPGFMEQSTLTQNLLLSLAHQLTIFWLWNMALLFTGARQALNGRWWACALALILWLVIVITIPALLAESLPANS